VDGNYLAASHKRRNGIYTVAKKQSMVARPSRQCWLTRPYQQAEGGCGRRLCVVAVGDVLGTGTVSRGDALSPALLPCGAVGNGERSAGPLSARWTRLRMRGAPSCPALTGCGGNISGIGQGHSVDSGSSPHLFGVDK